MVFDGGTERDSEELDRALQDNSEAKRGKQHVFLFPYKSLVKTKPTFLTLDRNVEEPFAKSNVRTTLDSLQ